MSTKQIINDDFYTESIEQSEEELNKQIESIKRLSEIATYTDEQMIDPYPMINITKEENEQEREYEYDENFISRDFKVDNKDFYT